MTAIVSDPVSNASDGSHWPAGTTMQGVRFAAAGTAGTAAAAGQAEAKLLELPAPVLRHAVAVDPGDASADLRVLTIPVEPPEPPDLAARVRAWVAPDGGTSATAEPSGYHFVHLHGAQVHWWLPRVAVVAPADRVDSVLRAALESAYLEMELHAVEAGLAAVWPDVEADAARAFEFRARDLKRRPHLAARFQRLVHLRSRLARVTPRLLVPPAYPPTLASQVLERFRERLGVTPRVEALGTQLDLFERVYDACGQRAHDFVLARKGLTLEWIIIILLAVQTFVLIFELL